MILHLYIYKCANCGYHFKVPELPGESYGDFLLRSDHNEIAYLMALDSKEFTEFAHLLATFTQLQNKDKAELAKIVHKIFGIACDLASDKSMYQITNSPKCPNCHSHEMASWIGTNPPEYIDESVKTITHERWNKLSFEQKKDAIAGAIKQII